LYSRGKAIEASDPNPNDIVAYIKQKWGVKEAHAAIEVAKCESGFQADVKNPNSSATGIFQIIAGTWTRNRLLMGRDASLHLRKDWIENIDTAHYIYERSDWGPWLASINCHGQN
jgi:hypothetical protein